MADSWKRNLARLANTVLRPVGLQLQRGDRVFDMAGLLERAARRGPAVATWIDVGASDGQWSLQARRHFPDAQFLLFEPLAERAAALAELAARRGFHIVGAAGGAAAGEVRFHVDAALDGSGVAAAHDAMARPVPMETIDRAVAARRLPGPYGIKLDTHGFELAVLAGAAATLRETELLVIEAYGFQLTPDTLRFHELCAWLETRGFRCCDIADPMRRPGDGAFWQVDLAFVRTSHPLFRHATYEAG